MKIGTLFILQAVQEHGQPDAERIAAVQSVLNEAGFKATAQGWPVFGGIWSKPCAGPDAEAATAFLQRLTDTMQRGSFEREVAHIDKLISEERSKRT